LKWTTPRYLPRGGGAAIGLSMQYFNNILVQS
jgi:hypothetical protein